MKTLNEYFPEYVDSVSGTIDAMFVCSNGTLINDYKENNIIFPGYLVNGKMDNTIPAHLVCDSDFFFQEFIDIERLYDDDVCVYDFDTLLDFGKGIGIIYEGNCFVYFKTMDNEDLEILLERFNDYFNTNFTTFKECFNFATDDDTGEGLSLSVNLLYRAEEN